MEERKTVNNLVTQFEYELTLIKNEMDMSDLGLNENKKIIRFDQKELRTKLFDIEKHFRQIKVREQMEIDDLVASQRLLIEENNKFRVSNQKFEVILQELQDKKNELENLKLKENELLNNLEKLKIKQTQLIGSIECHEQKKAELTVSLNEELDKMRLKAKMKIEEQFEENSLECENRLKKAKTDILDMSKIADEECRKLRLSISCDAKNRIKSEALALSKVVGEWFVLKNSSNKNIAGEISKEDILAELLPKILDVLNNRNCQLEKETQTLSVKTSFVNKILKKWWSV